MDKDLSKNSILVYTDGSCDPQLKLGGWAAIIFIDNRKHLIQGREENTTHNRMELLAVIKSIEFILSITADPPAIIIHSDSQYVVNIPQRMEKLISNNFLTRGGKPIQNKDQVKHLIKQINSSNINFIKVKAHQKKTSDDNFNREVDKLSRRIVRKGR